MGTRSTMRWALSGYMFALLVFFVEMGLQVSGVENLGLAIALWSIAGVSFLVIGFLIFKWFREAKYGKYLEFGVWNGSVGVKPELSEWEWKYNIPGVNTSDEHHIGIREIRLLIQRGSRRRELTPENFEHLYFGPKQPFTLHLLFSSFKGLDTENEDIEDYEEATIFLVDTNNNSYDIVRDRYGTNFGQNHD